MRSERSLVARLRANRVRLEAWLGERGIAHTLSVQRYQVHRRSVPFVRAHLSGVCLDIGAGFAPYAAALDSVVERVIRFDVEDRSGAVDVIGDVQAMTAIESDSIDSVLCAQVLEHVPRPWRAFEEIARVLRPGGHLVLTVPHLSVIHEAPNDFYRYTRYGLAQLAEQAGLEVVAVEEAGGLVSFLAHPVSYVVLSTFAGIPLLRELVWGVHYVFGVRLLALIDEVLGAPSTAPCNYVLVARRPSSGSESATDSVGGIEARPNTTAK